MEQVQRITIKQYIKFVGIYVSAIVLSIVFFHYFFDVEFEYTGFEKHRDLFLVISIFLRNTKNCLQYILLAPIMPILYIMDILFTSWNISLALNEYGILTALGRLLPHGIIEIPNFCLYTLLSYKLMKKFYSKNVRIKDYPGIVFQYKKILFLNLFLVAIAALLEGLLT